MLLMGRDAAEKAARIVREARAAFNSCHVHFIANFDYATRETLKDTQAVIAARAENESKINLSLLRLRELGVTYSIYRSEIEFLSGVATSDVDWSRPIQLAYNAGKYSTVDGIRCLAPIICALRSIQCTNSGVAGRLLGWNKYLSTQILRANGIPTPSSWHFRANVSWKGGKGPPEGLDLIVKNNTEAWGLGVSEKPVIRAATLDAVTSICQKICAATGLSELIVQEFIGGPEVYTSVFRSRDDFLVFPPMEISIDDRDWSPGDPIGLALNCRHRHRFRPLQSVQLVRRISNLAAQAMEELEMDIISRMDFRIDQHGEPRLFDMAEVPGINEGHAVAESLKASGASFDAWELMLALNVKRGTPLKPTEATSAPQG